MPSFDDVFTPNSIWEGSGAREFFETLAATGRAHVIFASKTDPWVEAELQQIFGETRPIIIYDSDETWGRCNELEDCFVYGRSADFAAYGVCFEKGDYLRIVDGKVELIHDD